MAKSGNRQENECGQSVAGSNPLDGCFVDLIVATWAYRHNQNLNYLCVNAVHNTYITGTDTAATGQFTG